METMIQRVNGGKNTKLFYFINAYMRRMIPRQWLMMRRGKILEKLRKRPDFEQLKERIDYYCPFKKGTLSPGSRLISGKQDWDYFSSVYKLDSEEVRRYFPKHLKWEIVSGDNTETHESPVIVKSRKVSSAFGCDVLLKLNRVRHFIFLRDKLELEQKLPLALFRGRIGKQQRRLEFIRKFEDSFLVDAGCIDFPDGINPQWHRPKMTLYDHFNYRYIVCLEGNDVASNLKWVMHSNSVAVMPKPRYETWFMEGRLIPDHHYICIADDFSDLEDKIIYYNAHPEEARRIAQNAREWTRQFKNSRLERHLGVAVMHNYLVRTGQLDEPEI